VERKPAHPVKEKAQEIKRKTKRHIWLGHKKCSKKNEEKVWYTFYNRRCRSIMERTFQIEHVYSS